MNTVTSRAISRGAAGMALALTLVAPLAAKEGQGAVGLDETKEELKAASSIAGLVFTMLDRLPRAPGRGSKAPEFCTSYVTEPKSVGARNARALGWTVTGEAPLGPLVAVSFAGGFEPATSGTCVVQNGNVGIFNQEGELVALAYAARGSTKSIGRVSGLESGAVRIWDGDPPGTPVADIERHNGGYLLRLGALAAKETLCSGRASVPNIYGLGIDRARRALMQSGWTPVPSTADQDERFGREKELRKRGIVEVDGCSGTGFGYCSFGYKGPAGTLSVTTMGDGDFPTVSGYGATCS